MPKAGIEPAQLAWKARILPLNDLGKFSFLPLSTLYVLRGASTIPVNLLNPIIELVVRTFQRYRR